MIKLLAFFSVAGIALAETVTLPVCEVFEKADMRMSNHPGRVVPISQVNVVPQVSGEILEVCFENGAMVKEGDVLYRLDPVKYEAAVKNAESKVAECKSNVSYSELSYERHKKLLATRAVSLDAVDNALSVRDSARAAYAAAQADLIAAKDDLSHCTIIAPISGKLGSTLMTRGNYVKAGGDTLVTIVQTKPIRVRFSISNREALDLFGGDIRGRQGEFSVKLTLANGTQYGADGKIEYVDNVADENTDTVFLYSIFENSDMHLIPGGTVMVTLSSKRGVLRPAIPPTAVLQDVQGSYVWVLDDKNQPSRRSIARGEAVDDWLFVEKGLKCGERIVYDGAHKVKRGMTIEAAK